ncbi:MAG: HFX_2341 family transcriptional regulator domain-containing protein [Methanobacteriota archaeon]
MVKVLHLATVGEDVDPVLIGIREYPLSKLVLFHMKKDKDTVRALAEKVSLLKVDVERVEVGPDILMDTLREVGRIVTEGRLRFDDVIINVSSGDKMLTCSALSAAFVHGIKAIGVNEKNMCFALPVLKFSYAELVSEPKLAILRSLDRAGGVADSLNDLSTASGVEKSLLSYHIRGGRDNKGLEELGLVEVDRAQQGRLVIKLTEMGRLLLIGREQTTKPV